MADKYKTGDVVQLKSGGPKMTVRTYDQVSDKAKVHCQWFAGSKLEQGWFPEESLEVPSAETKR